MRRLRWVQIRDVRAAGHHVDLDDVTAGGPDYEDEGYEIVSESRADTEYAVGYAPDGTPVLIDEEGHAYAVEAGAIYEQPYQGIVWRLVGELTNYASRKAGRPKKEQPYERHGEWSGYTVRKSEKGFIVEWWTARQGETTDARYLVGYGDGYGPETDLASRHNELMTVGDYIYACTEDPAIARVRVSCLRLGRIVR